MMKKAILAALVALAVVPATANAATYAVTETTDAPLESGATECKSTNAGQGCTLRAAVELANAEGGEATIELPEGSYRETASPEYIDVEKEANVTIKGAGAAGTTVEGQGNYDVFEVEPDAALTLEGVTVKKGSDDEGGGAWVGTDGSLTVRHSTFTENHANQGGAIFASDYSTVEIEDSSIIDNTALYLGGGVFLESGQECVVAKTSAQTARPALDSTLESGLTIVRSTIEGNSATEGEGGGIAAEPRICGGVAATRTNAEPKASAIGLDEGEASILIEQSAITHNQAFSEEDDEYGGYGGGAYFDGEIYDPIVDTTIAENFATYEGGGVYVTYGEESLVSDTVANNDVEPEVHDQGKARPAIAESYALHGSNLATYDNGNSEDEGSGGYIYLRNTIVSEEPHGEEVNNCSGRVESLIEESGYNLDYPSTPTEGPTDSCGMSEKENDLIGTDPKLDPKGLQDNGGSTQTIALTSESPAIGYVPVKGDCEEEEIGPAIELEEGKSKPVDQRSEPRPGIAGEGCDIGAYEYQGTPKKKEEAPKKEEVKEAAPVVTPAAKTEVLSVKVSSPPECTSKRDITIHIQNVKQFGVVSATVSIDGKARRTLRGKHLTTGIDLVGLPKGTFTIAIVAHTESGHTLHGQRVYHTCHTKLPGHIYLRL